jgi:hypothetical protein
LGSGDDLALGECARVNKLDGHSRADQWNAPPIHIPEPLLDPPDSWYCVGIGTAGSVLGPRAFESTAHMMLQAGELLLMRIGEQELWVANVTSVVDCLDVEGSSRDHSFLIDRFAFVAHRLPEQSLFKTPETCSTDVFVLERDGDVDLEFRARVDALGLSGLRFTEIWNTEDGAKEIESFGFNRGLPSDT